MKVLDRARSAKNCPRSSPPSAWSLLDWWDNGIRHTTNSKRSIKKPADLKGLKIRTPADAMTVDIFQALGAATQQIAFGELYIALQQGVVDGQENPLANIHSAKLYEVNKFISLTGHKWQSTPFLMSRISTKKVKPNELDMIKAAAKEAGALQRKLMAETDASCSPSTRPTRRSSSTSPIARHSALRRRASSRTGSKSPSAPFVGKIAAAAKA